MLSRRLHQLMLMLSLVPLAAAAAEAPPPVERFFGHSTFGAAVLSPDGKLLAARMGAPDRHDFLAVIDLETNQPTVVASYNDADVASFRWVNDKRLVFTMGEKNTGVGNMRYWPGLFAVNHDGSQLVQLAETTHGGVVGARSLASRKLLPANTFLLSQKGAQDSDYIYVSSPQWSEKDEVRYANLLRLNTVTGQARTVARPGPIREWILDFKGEPRAAVTHDDGITTLLYRQPGTDDWRKIASYRSYSDWRNAITPLDFGPDGTLYVEAHAGNDTSSVHTFDLASGKINPTPLISAKGYDFSGRLIMDSKKVIGALITTDARSNEWFDAEMKALQAKIDQLLPATINVISVARRGDAPWVLVDAYSDVIPRTYWLYNKKTNEISKVAETRPGLDPKRLGRQQVVRYKARDGLEIPARLTLPAGSKGNNPMVVLVHGGPWSRAAVWGFDAEVQFLASRGYAVLEPDFRGSTGYGGNHLSASFKQWGLAMQDDVADGARWAIGKGYADPKRICIAGASYGGYATLMGLVNDPDLFKCGINWVGVTDINLMYNDSWSHSSDLSDDWKNLGMPVMIGDKVKDAAQLKATSPIEQAARITQPLLLAYGGADQRVPIHHGTKFYNAVKHHNPNVEWIEYPEEGHGWDLPKNAIDFWTRVERFLAKNIGAAQPAPAK